MSSSATSQSREQHVTRKSIAGLAPLGASCLWGGMYVVSKAKLCQYSSGYIGLLRLLIGGITLSILLWFANRRQSKTRSNFSFTAGRASDFPGWESVLQSASLRNPWELTWQLPTKLPYLQTMTPVFIIPIAWLLLANVRASLCASDVCASRLFP